MRAVLLSQPTNGSVTSDTSSPVWASTFPLTHHRGSSGPSFLQVLKACGISGIKFKEEKNCTPSLSYPRKVPIMLSKNKLGESLSLVRLCAPPRSGMESIQHMGLPCPGQSLAHTGNQKSFWSVSSETLRSPCKVRGVRKDHMGILRK